MNAKEQIDPYDEGKLVEMAVQGDLEAFNQLVLRYQDMAYHHAYSVLGEADAAEDATQEAFIHAFQGLRAFRGGSFRGWLLRIVTNSAYDLLRKSHRYPTQPLFPVDENGEESESVPWLADPSLSVQNTIEQNEDSKRLYRMLDELPEAYRSAIELVDLYELDYAEAAQVLKVPIGTVKSRLARARLQMRDKLQRGAKHPLYLETAGKSPLACARLPC